MDRCLMYPRASVLAEGKTQRIWELKGTSAVIDQEQKDDMTAGNGAKHDVALGKGQAANITACNCFELLAAHGLPVAYRAQLSDTSMLAEPLEMIKLEVVTRFYAHGSSLKRDPSLKRGDKFENPRVEFYLKTTGRVWGEHTLPCDDPLMKFTHQGREAHLYLPDVPLDEQVPFLILDDYPLCNDQTTLNAIRALALRSSTILKTAFAGLGFTYVDGKEEFGFNRFRKLRVGDVIEPGSFRLVDADGSYMDKQRYRDGEPAEATVRKFQEVAQLTRSFVQ